VLDNVITKSKQQFMKKIQLTTCVLILSIISIKAQIYHSVATFSYSNDGLYAKVIKANPSNPKVIYMGAQNVNSSYKGFFDTYDLSKPDSIKRTKRLGILTDSFGVTDFVFRGSDIYAIGSKGLQILNVSTPTNPVLSKNIKTFKDGNSTSNFGYMTASIFIEDNKMHYGGFDYKLLDISNLNLLIKLAAKSYSGINSGSIQRIAANKVIVGNGYDLLVLDVSAAPTITSTTVSTLYGDPKQMLYDEPNKVLYTTFETSSRNYIYSINMTNNAKLDSFNYLSIAGFNPSSHSGMFLFKDTLYIGTSIGVALFDVSNPSKLQFLGKLPTGGSNAVFVNEEYLIANDNYNLRFYKRGPALTTSVHEQIKLITTELYPNPTSGIVTISSTQAIANIEVFDVTGKLVYNQQNNNNQTNLEIDLSALSNGIYFINTQNNFGGISKSKVVVSK